MTIRWRLGVLALQLLVLGAATAIVRGQPVSGETWFFAGLLAVVVNPQLLEPWYPRPQDVLVNSLIGLALYRVTPHDAGGAGWTILAGFLILSGLSALLALVLGAGREEGLGVPIGRGASAVSRVGSAAIIYSAIFWLSLVEAHVRPQGTFWLLGGAWVVIMVLGAVNWQAAWAVVAQRPLPCTPEAMVGPSVLMVASTQLPASGTTVQLQAGDLTAEGVVLTRIQRATDAWAEIFIARAEDCEALVRSVSMQLSVTEGRDRSVVGSVDVGSTDRSVRFVATRGLEIGSVVTVAAGDQDVLYQISFAEVDQSNVRGGAHLIVRARGLQLGSYDAATNRIGRHRWVPAPGAAVRQSSEVVTPRQAPPTWFQVGRVIGTAIPVYMDLSAMCNGHLAILGMTRMGKTTLAVRLAEALAAQYRVTVLDQTGEYVHKRGYERYQEQHEDHVGLSVFEPKPGETPADRALSYLEWLVKKAAREYEQGEPRKRVVMMEEAHQFVPEPAGMGFGAPGREASYKFGLLMMQVRKYGISIVLISQRTAVVAKSALSQCENIIAFKSVDQTGLDYLEAIAGAEARNILPTLEQGRALLFGPAFSSDAPVAIELPPPGAPAPSAASA